MRSAAPVTEQAMSLLRMMAKTHRLGLTNALLYSKGDFEKDVGVQELIEAGYVSITPQDNGYLVLHPTEKGLAALKE